jgi:tRNA(Ile)-lysidine synthase
MVLAHLALQCQFNFSLAHCNYKLRSEDSDLDEALVTAWSSENNIELFVKTFDLSEEKSSIQLTARNLRYAWFGQLMNTEGFDYVLTAHHADDAMETFFINLSRGTGLDGLTGIPQKNERIVRPLLPFQKKEILDFAKSQNIPWREDESNTSLNYVRNGIRLQIVPKFTEINPSFPKSFGRTLEYLGLSNQVLRNYAEELKKRLFLAHEDGIHISIQELKKLTPLQGYLFVLFSTYGFTQWEDIIEILDAQSGKAIRSNSHRIIKDRETLILTPVVESNYEEHLIHKHEIVWNGPIILNIEKVSAMNTSLPNTIYVDKETLNYPLKLRKWKIGDYFYPLGLNGRKKVSKFFKDEKYSTVQKENQWLLCSESDIVWVLGKRLDERFKVTDQTKEILKFTWVS